MKASKISWLALLLIGAVPIASVAGPIAHEYDGVTWGDSLADIVGKRPAGEHFFAFGGGQRDYEVPDEKTLFGISRKHMRVYYFLDETGSVASASITFPYDQRTKLLGALTLSFGPYSRSFTRGISTFYSWPRDDGATIAVEATLDPSFGLLRLIVFGPNSTLDKKSEANCNRKAPR